VTAATGTGLTVTDLTAGHGLLTAVRQVSLAVAPGGVLALVGANGAGKTTLLRCLAGAHPATSGRVHLGGSDVTALPAHRRARLGLALVPEGRQLFPELTVAENLAVAASAGRPGRWDAATVVEAFPLLKGLERRRASRLSGGQQQAVAIARALVTNPAVLMLDEVSLGLSPAAVEGVYASLAGLRSSGVTLLLVEQDLGRAMTFADRLICMLEGRVVLEGACAHLTRDQVTDAYFGLAATGSREPE
jgi:branched-chain amino acid transport system ATP-binding protein